jgi:protein-glucosylgalactosylhydroxylysine glucosidase
VLRIADDELFESHIKGWKSFWSNFQVDVDDDELVRNFYRNIRFAVAHEFFTFSQFRAIISSIFYLKSSLPTMESNLPQHPFYGLSPTGLGRGGSDRNDYEVGKIIIDVLDFVRDLDVVLNDFDET